MTQQRFTILVAIFIVCVAMLAVDFPIVQRAESATPNRTTGWEQVVKVINTHFARLPGYHPFALITQSDVAPLWQQLASAKWNVPQAERNAITKLVPTDAEFLVRQLRTASGRTFMRRVATKYPEIYDRLDLLSSTPGGGKPAVSGLIAAPDAELTVKYMFTKSGERSWAAMLPEHKSFNKPTGRIYTAESLTSRLQQLYLGSK